MELSWRTALILAGLIVVVLIVVDGIRRMRRARAEALKLDISNEFRFPEDDHNPELPSGGFRVVNSGGRPVASREASSSTRQVSSSACPISPENNTEEKHADMRFKGMSSARKVEHERQEPVFGGDVPLLDEVDEPELESTPVKKLQETAAVTTGMTANHTHHEPDMSSNEEAESGSFEQEQHSFSNGLHSQALDVADDAFENTISTWLDEREGQAKPLSEGVADSAARMENSQAAIIPKARPIDLDEEVPLLMSVESLGDREVVIEEQEDVSEPVTQSEEPGIASARQEDADSHEPAFEYPDEELHDPDLVAEAEASEEASLYQPKAPDPVVYANPDADQLALRREPEVVLAIHAFSRDDKGFSGQALLHLFGACDLRYGKEGIFHRFEEADGRGPIQFSVSQTFEPGIFTPATIADETFTSLSFFMSLPGPVRPLEAYLAMSEMARVMETQFDAELLDSSRSVFTRQTVEHDRQQIMEFERRQRLKEKKAASGGKRRWR